MRTASLILAVSLLATAGAAPAAKKDPLADPAYQVSYADMDTAPQVPNGAIYQASMGYSPLINGARAASVGDIVTILLVERTDASKSTSANTDRSANIGITPPSSGLFSKLFSATDASASGAQGFKGKGDAAQSNALNGEITVTVAKVKCPSGGPHRARRAGRQDARHRQ